MRKNAPLAFRIPSDLKKALQQIASREARSNHLRCCEILLTIGTENYDKEGSKCDSFYTRYLASTEKNLSLGTVKRNVVTHGLRKAN